MKVIRISPGAKFEIKDIEPGYLSMQRQVGGLVTTAIVSQSIRKNGIVTYADDESIINEKPLTLIVTDKNSNIQQFLYGPLVFVGDDGMGGDKDLTDDQIKMIKETLREVYIQFGITKEDAPEIFWVEEDY